MKTSVTFTFILLFIGVGISYIYLNPSAPKPLELPSAGMELLSREEGDIRLIQIQNLDNHKIITMERSGNTWMIRYPVRYPADPMMAEGLAAALKYSKKARRMPAQRNWEEYGLWRPSLKIGVETERSERGERGGEKRKYLYLGDPAPVGAFVFARWEGEKEYFLIQSQLKNAFNVSLYSLRMKRLFTLPLKDISKIKVRTFSQEFELEKRGTDWFWMQPIALLGTRIPEKKIRKILSLREGLYVKDFLDGEPADDAKAFPETPASITMFAENGAQEGLRVGLELPNRDAHYAKQESSAAGAGPVLLVSKERIQDFFSLFHEESQPPPSEK